MILAQADRIPPFLCRLIARKNCGWHPMSHADIARAAGLPRSTVSDLSKKDTWAGVEITVIDRFSRACGVDLTHAELALKGLRQGSFRRFTTANAHQRLFFQRLFAIKLSGDESTSNLPAPRPRSATTSHPSTPRESRT